MKLEPRHIKFFETPEELRIGSTPTTRAADLWLGSYRKGSGKPSVSWSDAVDEALCVGWIDSIRKPLDDTRSAQRFTPRRKGSNWSAINVDKVAALTAEGRMRPAGLLAFEGRTAARTGVYSYERAEALFADEELERFRAVPAAWADWERRAPSYRGRHVLGDQREGAPTRGRGRLEALIADSAAGVPCVR